MATRKRNSTDSRRTLLLVTATEAEALFFSQMRKDCRYGNLTVVNAAAGSLKQLLTFARREKNRKRCRNSRSSRRLQFWMVSGNSDSRMDGGRLSPYVPN